MKFNICIIQPANYIHIFAFWEIAEAIHFSLIELGYESTLQLKKLEKDAVNIVFGCHLLEIELIPKIPKSTIFINTEQINSLEEVLIKRISSFARNFEMWDYSERNITKFQELNIPNVKSLKLGFQKELVRIKKSLNPDIDVLFYGSINERRQKIISQLISRGLKVKSVFGLYGKERDELISRSKVILNHHYYESEIFEIIRVFYLLTNSVAVVGEVNGTTSIDEIYKDAICAATYDELAEACFRVSSDKLFREEMSVRGFETFSKIPQSIYTKSLIDKTIY